MLLIDLIDGLDILYTRGNLDVDIKGIAYDSRNVGKGCLFVCIGGMKTDGHAYAKQALENGAAAFIAQKPLMLETEAPVIITSNTREALAYVMADEGVQDVVMEVSSQGLALHRVKYCDFDTAVFTNLSRDHISPSEHASMDEYLEAKTLLFRYCRTGLVNRDCSYADRVIEKAECSILTYSINGETDIRAVNPVYLPGAVRFGMVSPWYNRSFSVNIPGRFTVYNALAAASVSGVAGIPEDAVALGLERVQVPGRAEPVETGRGFSVIIDYAHTPDSLENILITVKAFTRGKVICVFGCGGDRDRTKRPMMGAISGQYADYTVITSDNPRTEDPDAIIRDIEEGIKTTSGRYTCITDRKEAIRHALTAASAGDAVLLAGKGHETYQIFADRTIHFDEREIIREILDNDF